MAADKKYAFLMIKYNTPSFIKDIQKQLSDDDLYVNNDENSNFHYGKENDTHVTLVPCLDNDVNIDNIKKMLKPLSDYQIFLTNVSKFDNKEYEVLKCDVASMPLFNTNYIIRSKYKTHTEYNEYHPHITIAYVKHGIADKFCKDALDRLIMLEPTSFWLSYYDKNGRKQEMLWK